MGAHSHCLLLWELEAPGPSVPQHSPWGQKGAAAILPRGSASLGWSVVQGGHCHFSCGISSTIFSIARCTLRLCLVLRRVPTATADGEQDRAVARCLSQCPNTPPSPYQNQHLIWNINTCCYLPRLRVSPNTGILRQRDVPQQREDRTWMP